MDRKILLVKAERALAIAWSRFDSLYGSKIGKRPMIKLNGRLKTTAGRAWIDDGFIDLSVSLFAEFTSGFERETIPHECAHFVAYRVFGEANHGKPWKDVMRAYGIAPNTYHNYLEQRIIRQALK